MKELTAYNVGNWLRKRHPVIWQHTVVTILNNRKIMLTVDIPAVISRIIDPDLNTEIARVAAEDNLYHTLLELRRDLERTTNDRAFDGIRGHKVLITGLPEHDLIRSNARWGDIK